jgi:CDP-diacylglycerol pyrophosphatase
MLKRSLILVLSLVVIVCFAGMVFAQASTPANTAKPKTETVKNEKAERAPMHKRMPQDRVFGTLVSVDPTANTIVVKEKAGQETIQVDPSAKVTVDKKESKLADLTKDMKVAVSYKMVEGKKVATAIMERTVKMEKKEKPAGK